MLIGIDVCHKGKHSNVGFCATINSSLSKYYSQRIVLARGQEVVNSKLTDALRRAIETFAEHSELHAYPQHFIIYRDGVGDSMQQQIISTECRQFNDAIKLMYNKAATTPALTLVIVNKRIQQRFFAGTDMNLQNPPSGTIIDKALVKNEEDNTTYDFFLVPQECTQGCVLPTHFYVALNTSSIQKQTLEKLTYDLCHYYFNWAGPIKVPAPCMYAHKIAKLFMDIEKNVKKDMNCSMIEESLSAKLHFL